MSNCFTKISGLCRLPIAALAMVLVLSAGTAKADQNHPHLDGLFKQLQAAGSAAEATSVEARIWSIWIINGQELVDSAMARGLIAMNRGALKASLRYFDDVVALAPEFAEGWNKRATVHFLMGDYEKSIQDVNRTLELEPRHFGALSGLGLMYKDLGRKAEAIAAMEAALKIHPNMEGIQTQLRNLRLEVEGQKT